MNKFSPKIDRNVGLNSIPYNSDDELIMDAVHIDLVDFAIISLFIFNCRKDRRQAQHLR